MVQFGVHLHPYDGFAGLEALCAFVERAEALGYAYVHLPEHVIFDAALESELGRLWWDPLLLAAHLAARTSRIRFFFAVLVLPVHDPTRLAKSLATLDHMSGGRITVGVGLGSSRREFEALGRAFSERAARTEETIRALRALWTSDPCTFDGRWLSFHEQSFHPKPVQRPHPPIFVGGGVRTSVARAAALGDGWLPMSATLAELEAGIDQLHRELSARGRTSEGFPVVNKLPAHEPSARTARHAVRSGASPVPVLNGDPGRMRAYAQEAEALGVTHLWVELPAADRIRHAERMARVLRLG